MTLSCILRRSTNLIMESTFAWQRIALETARRSTSSGCKIPWSQWSQWMPPAPLLTISPIQLSFHLPSLPPLLLPLIPLSLLPALIPPPSLHLALIPHPSLLPALILPLFPALILHLPPHSLNFPPPLLLPLPLPTLCLTWTQPSLNSPQPPFQMSSFLAFPSFLT
ncbi:unnamed protein product [Tetraodon nigroviridis]|uniref:(spotted green pufferfish) hypothetical protein n=1 Tax=Tetraodon nigroviridis TaxID=99883 RepID=Q4TA31_TETNG|nr:unnamed protein product [Tetraodon nigroviridis]